MFVLDDNYHSNINLVWALTLVSISFDFALKSTVYTFVWATLWGAGHREVHPYLSSVWITARGFLLVSQIAYSVGDSV